MGLSKDYERELDDDAQSFSDFPLEEEEDLAHKKQVRKLLEEKLERKRIREDIDELDGDFDWDELER
ncbi:Uncharacterised protein [Legionella beliardensis]|uniref:Uncharacterized protein n=1 Tax=Legionella beliardensis TaxID=91822 RepID=A0A378I284_9GAMM|nr:hypothetical protein [Legionella beliardensis]STX29062.1 Uncharacterised protein [Legionella beliardensis]